MEYDVSYLLRNTGRGNRQDWLSSMKFISLGLVSSIIDDVTVNVTKVVRTTSVPVTLTVPLVDFGSTLYEKRVSPVVGDLVLLLFLDKSDPAMFDDAVERLTATNDWTVFNGNATGYNHYSAIGILMRPFRGVSSTVDTHTQDASGAQYWSIKSNETFQALMQQAVSLVFDASPNSDGTFSQKVVNLLFGQNSPFTLNHWASVTRLYGFNILPDNTLMTVSAPVTEMYSRMAPISRNIQSNLTEVYGLEFSPEGNFSATAFNEVVATIQKTYHGKVTLDYDIRGSLSMTFGIGNAQDGNTTEARNAPVTLTFGAQAPLSLTSKAAFTAQFAGAVSLTTTTTDLVELGNSIDTLGAIVSDLVNDLINTAPMIVSGGSGSPNPVFITALNTWLTKWQTVFK